LLVVRDVKVNNIPTPIGYERRQNPMAERLDVEE